MYYSNVFYFLIIESNVTTKTITEANRPVIPQVDCSHRVPGFELCCTWFGYKNQNSQTVEIPKGNPRKWFTEPEPTNDQQPE